ncbi:NAD kinase [Dermatophilaceae bacterium Sec6.4]
MNRRIALIGHPRRAEAVDIALALVRDLAAADVQVTGPEDELEAFGVLAEPNVSVDCGRCVAGSELAVVLGGDGTILRAAELMRDEGVPLLGINLGHVGFLAEADRDDVHATVAKIVDRSWTVEERMTLQVEVSLDGSVRWTGWALNEASVEKRSRERMLELILEIDDRPLSTWGADGIVMATPTGSTAYAFSAGGPVVWPGVEALLVVPISAHALFARPLVIDHNSRVGVELMQRTGAEAVVWCDGRRSFDIPPGARIDVRRSDRPVRLARLSAAPFTDRLVAKFDLSVSGWRGLDGAVVPADPR